MTKDDFFEKCLDIISTEGYPKAGISYIKLKSGEEGFLSGNIFHGLNPSEIAMFLLMLAKECSNVYAISPLYSHGLLRGKLSKDNSKLNDYMSFVSANYENTTDLALLDLEYPKFSKDEYDFNDECFSFNEKTKKLVRADVLSDIHKDILYNEVQQKLVFTSHWRKYYSRAKRGALEDDAIGENMLKDGLDINTIVKQHYYAHYDSLYKSISKLTDGIKNAIKSQEEEGDSEGDDFLKNLMNQLSKKDEDLLQDDINELKNKKNKKEDDEQSKSKLDSKDPKSSGESFLSKIKRKFK